MIIRNHTRLTCLNRQGFTLVELLIVMVIAAFVLTAIAATFQSQSKSYVVQDQISEMQQNLRAGMLLMMRDVRMAGYDPTRFGGYVALAAAPNSFSFTADLNDDGGIPGGGESFLFQLYDSDLDGINDSLRRTPPAGAAIAENIEALGFAYAYDTDIDGDPDTLILDTSPNGHVIWAIDVGGIWNRLDFDDDGDIDEADGPGHGATGPLNLVPTGTPVVLSDIRAVRIWMLGRTNRGKSGYVNNLTYVVGSDVITPKNDANPLNDNFHMKLVEANIKCRNLGL